MVDETQRPADQTAASRTAPAADRPNPVHAEIDRWFQDSFHGTRVGNDTETWNLVHAAKEDLKRRLAKVA